MAEDMPTPAMLLDISRTIMVRMVRLVRIVVRHRLTAVRSLIPAVSSLIPVVSSNSLYQGAPQLQQGVPGPTDPQNCGTPYDSKPCYGQSR